MFPLNRATHFGTGFLSHSHMPSGLFVPSSRVAGLLPQGRLQVRQLRLHRGQVLPELEEQVLSPRGSPRAWCSMYRAPDARCQGDVETAEVTCFSPWNLLFTLTLFFPLEPLFLTSEPRAKTGEVYGACVKRVREPGKLCRTKAETKGEHQVLSNKTLVK